MHIEIGGPPALPDRLDHLDRGDRVELLGRSPDNPAAGFRSGPTVWHRQSFRSAQLFCSADKVSPTTFAPRRAASIASVPQPQPISSNRSPGLSFSRSSSSPILRRCAASRSSPRREPRRRIGHARVQPLGVEVVAEIIMRGDILSRLAQTIVAQPVRQRIDPAPDPLGPADLAQRSPLSMNSSNSGTGSGELHSPAAQALYQPTEPDVASRTSASQLLSLTTATGPGR